MKNKIIAMFLFLGLFIISISMISATFSWRLYDDFSGGSLDTNKWIEYKGFQVNFFTDEHFVETLEGAFHIKQNIQGDRETNLRPNRQFTSGEAFSYEVIYKGGSGNHFSQPLINGNYPPTQVEPCLAPGGCGPIGFWNGVPDLGAQIGIYNLTYEFSSNQVKMTSTRPDGIVVINTFTGNSAPYTLTINTHTGGNGLMHFDYDNFKLYRLNSIPSLTLIPDQTWNKDTVLTINLTEYSSDSDGDDLNWSYSILNNVIVSIDNATGIATLVPNLKWFGTEYVIFTATDGIDSIDSNNITLNVINSAPNWSLISNQTWDEDTTFTINLTNYSSDPDGDDLNWTYSPLSNIVVTINNTNGIATLTPNSDWFGTEYIMFTATDNIDSNSSNNITLIVNDVAEPNNGGGGGGGGGGSSGNYYKCSEWGEWSICNNNLQTRTCIKKIQTTSSQGVILSKFNETETQTCASQVLTPLTGSVTEESDNNSNEEAEESTQKSESFRAGITGAVTGFAKTKGGKTFLIVLGVLALGWILLAFRRKIHK